MKKLLLAGITALSVLSASAAHAVTLPNTIIGTWCFLDGYQPNSEQVIYTTHTHTFKDCPPSVGRGTLDGIIISQENILGEDSDCTFEKIEKVRADIYMIYHRCKPPSEDSEEVGSGPKMYEIVDGKLVITSLPEG